MPALKSLLQRHLLNHRLRTYIFFILLATLPLTLLMAVGHRIIVRLAHERAAERSANLSSLVAQSFEERFTAGQKLLTSISERPSVIGAATASNWRALDEHLRKAHDLDPSFAFFSAYGTDGTLRSIYPPDPNVLNKNFAFRDWYKGVSRGWKPYVSEVYLTAVAPQQLVAAIAVPIRGSNGEPVGILMAPYPLETARGWINQETSIRNRKIVVIDQSGQFVTREEGQDATAPSRGLDNFPPAQLARSGKTGVGMFERDGQALQVAYAPIKSLGWGVLAEFPVAQIWSAIWGFERPVLLFLLPFVLLAASLGWLIASFHRQMQTSREEYSKLFEGLPYPMWVFDAETLRFLAVNDAAITKYGYSRSEFLNMSIRDIRPAEELPRLEEELQSSGSEQSFGVWRHKTKDGQLLDVEVTARPMTLGKRAVELVIAIDVTQRLRGEAQRRDLTIRLENANQALEQRNREVERANQLKSQFLANMSHELRTPLNAILGFSELLEDGTVGPLSDKQKHFVHRIRTGGKHLLQLINDILDLSKIEAGLLTLEKVPVRLQELLPEVLSVVKAIALPKQIQVVASCQLPHAVLADRVRLKQILYNLLSNAVKFTPAGGRVILSAVEKSGIAEIAVADNGIGIPDEEQALIFEEFRQGSGTHHEGTGLGLSITSRLVSQHGGIIRLESQVGAGSKFIFTLPLAATVEEELQPAAVRVGTGVGKKVLIVDDEAAARELLATHLQAAGFHTFFATSGDEAITQASTIHPDVITLDLLMPNGNGFGILFELRRRPETASIPVVVVSVVDNKAAGLALGAAEFLVKPVNREDLLRAVHACIGAAPADVVVLDDDQATCQAVSETLSLNGYRSQCFTDAAPALEHMQQNLPDVLILDLLMPGMSGFEVLDAVRRNQRTKDMAVLIITAKDLTKEERGQLLRQANALLLKNGDWKQRLINEVRKARQGDVTT